MKWTLHFCQMDPIHSFLRAFWIPRWASETQRQIFRIPLRVIQRIRFQFSNPSKGEIYVDDIEFSRLKRCPLDR